LRIGFAIAALVAIVAIAIPFAGEDLLRQSKAAAREGDLAAALGDARTAAGIQPYAASPRLQEALVLELQRDFAAAARAAGAATERESTNWRTWLVLSRVEAERGNAKAALAAYRKARSLYPLSPLFRD
jgi:tetratricopeptide (TPR) repeat protein